MPTDHPDDAAETPVVPALWQGTPARPSGAARFVLTFVLILGLQAGSVMAMNIAVDPRAEFGTGIVPPLTEDHASMRVHLLDTVAKPPRTLVLGNSRVMTMDTDDLAPLGPGPAFNFAIGGGTAGDAPTIYRFMTARGYPIDKVVYGLDMIQAAEDRGVNHKVANVPELARHIQAGEDQPSTWDKAVASIDGGYAWDSLRSLRYELTGRPASNVGYTDQGAVVKHGLQDALENGTFDPDARASLRLEAITDKLSSPHGYRSTDPSPVASLVEAAREDGATVRLFLPPQHPRLAEALANTTTYPERHAAFLDQLLDLCQPGVHLHDLRSIASFGGRADRFYDPWHPFGENHARVVEALKDPALDLCQR